MPNSDRYLLAFAAMHGNDMLVASQPAAHARESSLAEGGIGGQTTVAGLNALGGRGDDRIVANARDNVVDGAAGDDQLIGGGGADSLTGGSGRDTLSGGGGDDVLHGGAGADQLLLGRGADQAFGGEGNDIIRARADQLDQFDMIDGGAGFTDTLLLQSSGLLDLTALALFTGIERVRLAAGQEVFATDDSILWIGRNGGESLHLGDGDDTVKAGGDADFVFGGGGDDVLLGQGGDDVLAGGTGTDRLVGGVGADLIEIGPGDGVNIIYGFEPGIDALALGDFGFDDFASDIAPLLENLDGKTRLRLPDDALIVLQGISPGDLSAADFHFA